MNTRSSKRRKLNDRAKDCDVDQHTNKKYYDELKLNGFCILENEVELSDDIHKYIINQGNKNEQCVFNHNEKSKNNDRKRAQTPFYSEKSNSEKLSYAKHFMHDLNDKITNMFPHLVPNDWVIISSKPGCKDQAAHTDYVPSEEMEHDINNPNQCVD